MIKGFSNNTNICLKTGNNEATTDLYEWGDGEEELWVCEAHFTESWYEKPPSEYSVDDITVCHKCGEPFEKIKEHPGSDETGLYEPTCDCEHLEDIQLSVG